MDASNVGSVDSRLGKLGRVVAGLWAQLGKRPGYSLYAFLATAGLLWIGAQGKEQVGAYVAAVAAAYFGGGAWVKHSETR